MSSKLNLTRIHGLGSPVWGIRGLTDESLRTQLRLDMRANDALVFNESESGKKLSLEHKREHGLTIFSKSSCKKLCQNIISGENLRLITAQLKESDSVFKQLIKDEHTVLRPLSMASLCSGLVRTSNERPNPWLVDLRARHRSQSLHDLNNSYADAFNCIPFIPRMQFSIMRKGSYIPPHTDISNKIATLMIYLPA